MYSDDDTEQSQPFLLFENGKYYLVNCTGMICTHTEQEQDLGTTDQLETPLGTSNSDTDDSSSVNTSSDFDGISDTLEK